jgi:hypothetical protein
MRRQFVADVPSQQKRLAENRSSHDNSAIPEGIRRPRMFIASAVTLLQNSTFNPLAGFFGAGFFLCALAIGIIVIIGGWKTFEKAGKPGWAIIVPIYNVYVMLQIAGRPGWWLLLYLVPLANVVVGIVVAIDIAKAFGQSAMFGFFLLFLLGGVGYLVLGFGDYRYQGPVAAMAAGA